MSENNNEIIKEQAENETNAVEVNETTVKEANEASTEDVCEAPTAEEVKDEDQIAREEADKAKSKAEAELVAKKGNKLKKIWSKVTTGLLILLLTSPFLILAYILLWFIFRDQMGG